MKVARRTAQAFASMVVLSLLMSGSVFAYSTLLSHNSSLAAPPDKASTTTEQKNDQVTQNAQTSQADDNNGKQSEHLLEFKLMALGTTPTGKGDAEVQIRGTAITVGFQIEQALVNHKYFAALVPNPTASFTVTTAYCGGSLGTLMTNEEGEAEARLTTSLPIGNTFLALVLCSNGSTVAFVSDPLTRQATITASTPEKEDTDEVNAKQEDQQDQNDIKSAEDSKEITTVVEVSSSDSTITQLDPKFSASVSRPADNSLSVSIAGTNITGPRVLLINLAKDAGALSSLGSLRVTYDGNKISQASSLSQVLSGTSTSPPSYIVLGTSSGVQLLVFIPHFSSHLIELLALPAPFGTFTAQAPLLLAGFAVVAAVAAALYMRRNRFTAPAAL